MIAKRRRARVRIVLANGAAALLRRVRAGVIAVLALMLALLLYGWLSR